MSDRWKGHAAGRRGGRRGGTGVTGRAATAGRAGRVPSADLRRLVSAVGEPCARMVAQINEATTRLHAAVRRLGVRVPAGHAPFESLERRGLLSAGGPSDLDAPGATSAGAVYAANVPALAAAPSVTSTSPANGTTNVLRDAFVSANLSVTNGGIDVTTITADTVKLYRTADGAPVAASVNTSAGGDVLVLGPSAVLEPDTEYTFEVTPGLRDVTSVSFVPFLTRFRTGVTTAAGDSTLKFDKVTLAVPTAAYTTVTKGPDGRLYAGVETGEIYRFDIKPDGTLASPQLITALVDANGGEPRLLTGIEFDPHASANDLALWVSHSHAAIDNGPEWTGKITRLSGPDLAAVQDVVVGLPRSTRDHVTNQPKFGPDGALYFVQPGNTAMGAPDYAWHYRPERLMSGAVLRLDTGLARDRIAAGHGPVNVQTEDGGTYNPYAANAPVTIFATGIRNAFDLLWHSNGSLYAPTNGSQLGGATPAGPGVPGIGFVDQVEDDVLHRIVPGGYYGHPNPTRGQFVRNGGNPTDLPDRFEVPQYPVGTLPDPSYVGPFYTFGQHYSPNGVIEYRGGAFGGALAGKIMVARYSGGDDVVILTANPAGHIIDAKAGIEGLKNFNDPLDLTEDGATGFVYVAEFGGQTITLARPSVPGTPAGDPPRPARAPLAPYGLAVAVAGRDALELSWADTVGEGGYKVERAVEGTDAWTQVGSAGANVTRFVDSGVDRGTTYVYRVRATSNAGISKASPGVTGVAPSVILPAGWTGIDIGNPGGRRGTGDVVDGAFALGGGGAGIGGAADSFFLASVPVTGDVEIVARVRSLDPANPAAKAGVMLRAGNAADAPHAFVGLATGTGVEFQARTATAGETTDLTPDAVPDANPLWVRLVRRGMNVSGYTSADGVTWTRVGFVDVPLGEQVFAGLAVTSGDAAALSPAAFDTVSVNAAPPLAAPEAPADLVTAANGTRVALAWRDASLDEAGFEVQRRKSGSGNWVAVARVGPEQTGYTDDHLAASKKYDYRVVAVNAVGVSGATNEAQARTGKSPVKGQAPFTGAPAGVPGVIEAEAFDEGAKGKSWKDRTPDNDLGGFRDAGAEIQPTTDPAGGGYDVIAGKGEWVEYTVAAPAAGAYTIELRLAAPAGMGGTASVSVDGKKATVGGALTLPGTGGWDVWQTAGGVVNLKAGVQVLRLCVDAAPDPGGTAAAINWLRLTPAEASTAAAPTTAAQRAATPTRAALKSARVFDAVFNTASPIN